MIIITKYSHRQCCFPFFLCCCKLNLKSGISTRQRLRRVNCFCFTVSRYCVNKSFYCLLTLNDIYLRAPKSRERNIKSGVDRATECGKRGRHREAITDVHIYIFSSAFLRFIHLIISDLSFRLTPKP